MGRQQGKGELLEQRQALRLPTFAPYFEEFGKRAEREFFGIERYMQELSTAHLGEREVRRVERLLRASGQPKEKTLRTLSTEKLGTKVRRQLASLCSGEFVGRAENVLAFRNPGVGKTQLLCEVRHELVRRGIRVLFIPAHRLVQRLLVAKRELTLEQELKRLDAYGAVIVDDIGYVQQEREEMEVMFTLLAERYERRSVMISSNLVFSQWERIFMDPMTAAAAIDRLIHHAEIVELVGPSYRSERARVRVGAESDGRGVEAGVDAPEEALDFESRI